MYFTYHGRQVLIPPTADIETAYRPSGRFARYVQIMLDDLPPWPRGEEPIWTAEFRSLEIRPMAVPVRPSRRRIWGVHVGHKARQPGLSPFFDLRGKALYRLASEITIELTGSPESPVLVRAYSGDYTPPLPWMSSAKNADGGPEFCLEYWRTHAYRYSPLLVRKGTITQTPPEWFTS